MTPSDSLRSFTDHEIRLLWRSLRRPRARYDAARASQLSGVPRRTIYDWASANVVVPDFVDESPKMWSYRDLVLVRLTAWLRSKGMERELVSERVSHLRSIFERADEAAFAQVRSDGRSLILGEEGIDRFTGQLTLAEALRFLDEFDLLVPTEAGDLGRSNLWGPHLVRPTERTRLYPWVMGGEPCVVDTRIPTSTLFALHEERGLDEERISRLYPGLGEKDVDEAIQLERALRNHRKLAA